jgi:hypothetical protein
MICARQLGNNIQLTFIKFHQEHLPETPFFVIKFLLRELFNVTVCTKMGHHGVIVCSIVTGNITNLQRCQDSECRQKTNTIPYEQYQLVSRA